jgi:hypothetical protein
LASHTRTVLSCDPDDKQAKWPAVKFFNFTSAVYLLAKETAIYISLPNAS